MQDANTGLTSTAKTHQSPYDMHDANTELTSSVSRIHDVILLKGHLHALSPRIRRASLPRSSDIIKATARQGDSVDSYQTGSNARRALDVLWHDGNTLGVDGAQIRIFKKSDQIGL